MLLFGFHKEALRRFVFFLIISPAGILWPAQSRDLSPSKTIHVSQTDAFLLYGADFVVAEDGVIFVADAKDGNIKCYDPEGKLLKVVGRRGPGPEEFGSPTFCDYQTPFLSVLDSPKFKVHIYERKGRADLVKVAEIPCMMCTSDIILSAKGVLVDAYIHTNKGKFFLTLRAFRDDVIDYLLPIERKYGYESERSYKGNHEDLSKLTAGRGFLSILGNKVYYVPDIRLKITALRLDNLEVVTFGSPSPNYREPKVNQTIRDAFANKEGEPVNRERKKVSYITGILSDERMVGVLFSNYDVPSDTWKLYLQRYDPAGKLLSEDFLREATNYFSLFNYYFHRESGVLYVMAERYGDDTTDDYRILGYKLR